MTEKNEIIENNTNNSNNNIINLQEEPLIYNNPSLHQYNLSIAPMLEITTKHYMHFMRLLTKHTLLYSEMININEIIHKNNVLDFSPDLEPLCIQLGGSDPKNFAIAVEKIKHKGFKEININCGCPSKKVSAGNFGAVLMKDPDLVGECVKKMNEKIFSSIKCRLGLDVFEQNFLENFIEKTRKISGCKKYILHSRIAIMGIDTMKNRSVPPLQYDVVENIKKKYPELNIVINGGIKDFKTVKEFNEKNIGVMIGREAYDNPWKFRNADSDIFGKVNNKLNRKEIVYKYGDYCQKYIEEHQDEIGTGLFGEMVKPLTNLFFGEKFNKIFVNKLFKITQGSKDPNKKKDILKKYENISEHFNKCIEEFEKKNEDAVINI